MLWNFGTSACNVAFQDCNQGPVLAPNGSITAIASHNGSVFAKTVTNTNCEIHQNPFRSQKSVASSTKAALSVGAAVDSTGAAWAGTDALPFSVAMDPDRASAADALPASTTTSCEAGATASFGDVTYTHTGDYYYVISADPSSVDGMSAPTAKVYAHVSVTSLDAAPTVTYGTASGTYDSTDPGTLTATYTAPSTTDSSTTGSSTTVATTTGVTVSSTSNVQSVSSTSSVPNTGDPFSLAFPAVLVMAGIAIVLAVRPWGKDR